MNVSRLLVLLVGATIAACGGGGGGGGGGGVVPVACSVATQKQFVLDVTREWYLFPELLPAQVDVGSYATAQALLDALTAEARAQGKDRGFSFVTTRQADSSFFGEGQFVGFGFRNRIDSGNRVFFTDVFEGSPAGNAGITRGHELLAIDSGSGFVPVSQILVSDPNLTGAFGPATEGVQRGLRILRNGVTSEVTLTKVVVTIPPVPADGVEVLTLPLSPNVEVGYFALRTYISTAQDPLFAAFNDFRARGITDFIIDLRYNGGGLLSIAQVLADLLGGNRANLQDMMAGIRYRASKAGANNETVFFEPYAESVSPVRIAFITTGGSASASELSVSIMDPWVEVAIVGDDTFGKPVGQDAFDQPGCDTRLRLVTFRTVNAREQGDYYNGLAETLPGRACAAADDLSRSTSDPAEASTAEALRWLQTGACTQLISAAGTTGAQKLFAADARRFPEPDPANPVSYWLPGTF